MTEEIGIEIAQELSDGDLRSIALLLPQLSSTARFDPDRVRSMIEHSGVILFVARSSARIVGIATLVTFPLITGWRGLVEDVVVDESMRGRGVARRLLEHVIAESSARALRTLDLTSRPSRDSAHRLYESLGFTRRETTVLRVIPPPLP